MDTFVWGTLAFIGILIWGDSADDGDTLVWGN